MVSSVDVAKKANVSQATVSRVLNFPHKVRPKKREVVLAAIKELNYRPNTIARSLVNKKTMSITLISGPLHNQYFAESTTTIINMANKYGFRVTVHFDDVGDDLSVYQNILNEQVDGIILSSMFYDHHIFDELQKLHIPFIMFNRRHKKQGNFVEIDNEKAGFISIEYLIKHNHHEIIWCGGPLAISTFQGRFEGYHQALKKHNLPFKKENMMITDTTEKDVHHQLMQVVLRNNLPTAIFAATDSIALYAMDFLSKKGIRVPQDISIIGIDNIHFGAHHAIQLTTVSTVDNQDMSKLAIEHLLKLIQDKNIKLDLLQKTLDVQIIERGTVKEIQC